MEIIYVLIPIAMIFVAIAVMVFFWAVKSEQFDDLDRQSVSILFDEDTVKPNSHPVPEKQKAEAAQEKGMPL
ncbi:cbb3-type cytochrome oxidase assembly protein CcoS [Shewanella baltica]|uniref:cbb3-type cytochrome oxidase assembly protein CcoS n=1 Tax=Shewanella baltica TaxID=62322 RepID=UPI00217DD162|nr:cbb3-type cytochrome oxidase assembly protein CcoS [Shewanella baltica]MCS6128860.1 cbb3-type cytochrome oxidase assembly protein CcoS [Shewanella baltica]MCS6140791.1 cbb3-type cytochrome oxidase assembly protein CcoS [Shewanella baltica]MCS6147074.1 cbb3-type cytochrome oxidase assembly protein CcoS [Shewanella baltica]MCS6171604.1 cbb3-type cytochrome oxidase assembly protein CcoS [Shewanella baltica]MCS6188828.1 cbb3-type cytochrome oxidase assembly protein CcoS [Shewanella baltica]